MKVNAEAEEIHFSNCMKAKAKVVEEVLLMEMGAEAV